LAIAEAQKRGISQRHGMGETTTESGQTGVRGVVPNTLLFPRGGSQETVAGAETMSAHTEGKIGKTCTREVTSDSKTEDTVQIWGGCARRKCNTVI